VTGWLHAGHGGFAAVITAYGVGSVLGGAVTGRISRWLGAARAPAVGLVLQAGCLLVLGTVRSLPAAVTVMAVFGALGMVWNISEVTLIQERTPAALLGRVSAANRTLSVAGAPVGALLGGGAASAWGLNTPPLLAAALFGCAACVLIPALASFRRTIN
jgi:predicted MFS family arabinose efflux permease